jgi:hypothetical protein
MPALFRGAIYGGERGSIIAVTLMAKNLEPGTSEI